MIKKYYAIIKKFFSLKATNKVILFRLMLSATLRSLSLLTIPFVASKIVKYTTEGSFEMALLSIVMFLICSLTYVFFHHYNYASYSKNSIYTHNKLQELIMNKVTGYDENFTKNISTSYIVNTAFNDVGKVMQIPDLVFDAITEVLSIVITLIILMSVNVYMGLFVFVLLIISMIVLTKNVNKRDYYLSKQRQYQDSISGLLGQVLDGSKEIKAFNMTDDISGYMEDYKKFWKKNYTKKRVYEDNIWVTTPLILGLGKFIVYLLLIYLILEGKFDIATMILCIGYYETIEARFRRMYNCLNTLSSHAVRVDRIFKILNYNNKNMIEFGTHDNDFIKGKIEFQGVSFAYEKQTLMKNVSFSIEPNSFVAIVGKSGSGKSTIFRLLLRLYKADKGNILLDDVSIYDYNKEVYSSNVSIVTQKPFIFDMSIKENLSLVDSNQKHQIKACKRAGIHDYIMNLKDGYNTKLIGDAENISPGQKQLIALARTLLSKSEVLLFDEVTSSLDMNASKKIIDIMKDLKKDHTILMITHKPTLMKMADEIIVVDHGKIVGRGTHKELMKDNKYYQTLQK